jgi:hypothetical protein
MQMSCELSQVNKLRREEANSGANCSNLLGELFPIRGQLAVSLQGGVSTVFSP